MTYTISLFDGLLAKARRQILCHHHHLTTTTLHRLLGFPDLPNALAAQAQQILGDLHLRRRRYRAARRHLRQSRRLEPASARTWFLLGICDHHDPCGEDRRAIWYYEKSLQLNPNQMRCLGELGLLAITTGQWEKGIAHLRRAVELAPESVSALRRLCKGLQQTGQPEEALREVRLALFRNSHSSGIRQLHAELLADQIRCRQECDSSHQVREAEPVLLPFVRIATINETPRVTMDRPETLRGPHTFRLRRPSGRRVP